MGQTGTVIVLCGDQRCVIEPALAPASIRLECGGSALPPTTIPVILTMGEALALQRLLSDRALWVVARGGRD